MDTEKPSPLPVESLYRSCDPDSLPFESTDELEDFDGVAGQDRAVEAIRFSTEIEQHGYNLYVMGPPGAGRRDFVGQYLRPRAARQAPPEDVCYVNNFRDPRKPVALRLPAGQGVVLRDDVDQLVEDAQAAIPASFRSEDFQTQKEAIEEEFRELQESELQDIKRRAGEKGINILQTPTGVALAPLHKGKPIGPDEFRKLPEKERLRIERDSEILTKELRRVMRQAPVRARELRKRIRNLEREVTTLAVGDLVDELSAKYGQLPDVMAHLQRLQADIVENTGMFLATGEGPTPLKMLFGGEQPDEPSAAAAVRQRYAVNVAVEFDPDGGAPVVFEDQPGFADLVGRIEHRSQFGTLVADFSLIKAGALHRANGGYLVLDVREVLTRPYAWDALKRALKSREIAIRSLGESMSLISTETLEPEPVPLSVKVVLIGDRYLYYLLDELDPDFAELFKVAADFDNEIERTGDMVVQFTRQIATRARRDRLRPMDRDAVARTVEHGARLAGDAERLSGQVRDVYDVVCEANHLAGQAGRVIIGREDIQAAIDARVRRAARIRDRLQEEILHGTLLIDTAGSRVGQVNGLAVWHAAEFAFAHPTRITARVSLGSGEVLDIEREVELGGPVHSKGVLILAGFLGSRYVTHRPLSLAASLVFEQSYAGVEGDSASAAELCVLLSALADLPIRQDLAITGSVNQHGEIQAIGGVNEKIEGFFDVCRHRELTGKQGVLIPAANVRHLMLRHDVVEAADAGRFHIYAVRTIDECLALLTGVAPGRADDEGVFPEDTVNERVRQRLIGFAEERQAFSKASDDGEGGSE